MVLGRLLTTFHKRNAVFFSNSGRKDFARGNVAKTDCLIKRNISPVGEVFLALESVKLLRC